MQRTFVIADTHGEYDQLLVVMNQLQKLANLDLTKDWLVSLGDKIDRGRQSYEVVEYWRQLELQHPETVYCVNGNHEAMAIDAAQDMADMPLYCMNGGIRTIESYSKKTGFYGKRSFGNSLAVTGHAAFLKRHLPYLETDHYFFSHAPVPKVGWAGRRADRDFRQQQNLLIWAYAPVSEEQWVDPDPANGRICVYGHVHGLKEIQTTGPWGRADSEVYVPGVRRYGNAILLDTGCGCAREGYLSCLELPAMKVYDSLARTFQLEKQHDSR